MNKIKQPKWKKVEYSKKEINSAGELITNKSISKEQRDQALRVIDNWRAAHAFPLQVIYMNLKRMTEGKEGTIVAQRLKRLDSIENKLLRFPDMNLWRIQDLGGCRVIVNTIDEVYQNYKLYKNSRIRHVFKREYDYIKTPKESGYRSLHAVYQYHSDSSEDYNTNMLIEIQFRTHLQHIWATAVETMGLFTNQAIKSGKGDNDIKRFFVLISSLFAIRENCPVVPNTSEDIDELIHEIESINAKNNYLDFLSNIRVATKFEEDRKSKNKNEICILSLNYDKNQLSVKRFKSSEIEEANEYYSLAENSTTSDRTDIVLVRVSSFSTLKSAYPNYFTDISEFIAIVKEYLR